MPSHSRNPLVSQEVAAIRRQLTAFLGSTDDTGNVPANAQCGVYVFYDYDGEPIYVGQTFERVRVRIRRHLTNQRTDAVAMNVLDPFEVAEIEIYPFYDLERQPDESARDFRLRAQSILASAEFTVFQRVLEASSLGAVLNEKDIDPAPLIPLPSAHRGRIIPDDFWELRNHPDVRLARRASTVANLARVIAERGNVSTGLRRTLLVQARRIERLAGDRLDEVAGPGASNLSGSVETGTEDEGGNG